MIGLIFILNGFITTTGYVVMDQIGKPTSSIFGLILVVVGVALFIGGLEKRILKYKRKLEQAKQSGRIGSYDELKRIAKGMGYKISHGGNHDNIYDNNDRKITQIPRHKRRVATGTYNDIRNRLIHAS